MNAFITVLVVILLLACLITIPASAYHIRSVTLATLVFISSILVFGSLLFLWIVEWSPMTREEYSQRLVQDKLDAVPRVIKEFDNCKVWAFKNDKWVYTTICK